MPGDASQTEVLRAAAMDGSVQAAAWRAAVARVLNRADPGAALTSRARDGLVIRPLELPAEAPDPVLWRDASQPVSIVQRVEHPDPVEAGRLAAADAANGATGLALVMAGAASARSFGLPPDSADAFSPVLEGLDPHTVTLHCAFPPTSPATLVDAVLAAAARQGFVPTLLDLAADPLGDTARTGLMPDGIGAPVAAGIAAEADRWVRLLRDRGVTAPMLRADGRPHHEAGASDAEELAAVLSSGVLYTRSLERVGPASGALAFTLVADADLNWTIAKFRALRRLWARVEEACELTPTPIRLHAETAWRMLARRDAWTNLLRNTLACTGAILGGADSLTVLPFTSALGLPDPFARRLARNTPLVLLQESNLGRVADPSAGSGTLEAMTDALCRAAWSLFQELEVAGGLPEALRSGAWQARVAATREARHAELTAGRTCLVGVSAYGPKHETLPTVLMPMRRSATVAASRQEFAALPSIRDAAPFEDDALLSTSPGEVRA